MGCISAQFPPKLLFVLTVNYITAIRAPLYQRVSILPTSSHAWDLIRGLFTP